MKKVWFSGFMMVCFFQAFAAGPWEPLYINADYIAHIRITGDLIPSGFSHDLGTTWYQVNFVPLEVHKNRDTTRLASFWFVHHGYEAPDPATFPPGSEWIVFLSRTGFHEVAEINGKTEPADFLEAALMPEGKMQFTQTLNRDIRQMRNSTAFDIAVTSGDFTQVQELIFSRVQESSFRYGNDMHQAFADILAWLNSFATVDIAAGDTCATHICIYPGWYDIGIRFLTSQGPREYMLTLSMGKVLRLGCIGHLMKRSGQIDRVFLKSFQPAPGVLGQIHQTCIQYYFQCKQRWIRQEEIEISLQSLQDTISVVPGQMTMLTVKVKVLNKTGEVKTILWPVQQNSGFRQLRFRLHDEDGNVLEEEELFQTDAGLPPVDVTWIRLSPGDSLVSYQTINDFYAPFSDWSATHFFPWLREARYLISMIYEPRQDGDSSLFWNPPGGSIEVFYTMPLPAVFIMDPKEEERLTLRLITKGDYYENQYGQKSSYDGLAEVLGSSPGSAFRPGDTLAFRFPYTMYERSVPESRPALDVDLMEPGDLIQAEINSNYPVDMVKDGAAVKFRTVLLANRPDALKIIQ
ncbi:MAG TPA: hypothetical protein P5228_06525 [Bacteroidales bacterium]|nr:hypothetical protein [Bacteroidales bacterium]HRZ49699.1 hypothetical protein [Bacteroidales bacterium]